MTSTPKVALVAAVLILIVTPLPEATHELTTLDYVVKVESVI